MDLCGHISATYGEISEIKLLGWLGTVTLTTNAVTIQELLTASRKLRNKIMMRSNLVKE